MHSQIKIQEAQVVAPEINQWDECRYPTIRTCWKLSSKPRSHVEPIQPPPRGVPSVQAANLMISRVKASGDPSKIWHLQNKPMMLSWWQWCLKDVGPRHMIMHHTSQVTLLLMAALFWGCHWMLENPLASLVPGLHFFKRYASVLQDFQIPNGRYRKILSYLGASPWPPRGLLCSQGCSWSAYVIGDVWRRHPKANKVVQQWSIYPAPLQDMLMSNHWLNLAKMFKVSYLPIYCIVVFMDLNHNSQRLLLCAGSMTAACFNLEEDQGAHNNPISECRRSLEIPGRARAQSYTGISSRIRAPCPSAVLYIDLIYIILMHATCFERLYSQPLSEWAPYYQLEWSAWDIGQYRADNGRPGMCVG